MCDHQAYRANSGLTMRVGRRWAIVVGLGVVAALVAVVLATRAGDDGSSFGSAMEVAEAAGCSGYREIEPDFGTTETGDCRLDGEEVQVYLFNDRDTLLMLAEGGCGFGSDGEFTMGENWAITVADEDVADELGGRTEDVCS
jgi:hypothetical protein